MKFFEKKKKNKHENIKIKTEKGHYRVLETLPFSRFSVPHRKLFLNNLCWKFEA